MLKNLTHFSGIYVLLYSMLFCLCASTVSANSTLHKPFDHVLRNYVVDGHVNYKSIKSNPDFVSYLESLELAPSFQDKHDELAYWINAYNAFVIKGILDKRSPSTFLGRIGYFKTAKYQVGGKKINLYDLERKVIIPLGEPRIHFAINCASLSCPKLLSRAYRADKLEKQLEDSAKNFINDSTQNRFDRETKVAHISKIFDWFKKDFDTHSGSVQKYLAQYVDDPKLAEDLRSEKYRIQYLKYDWSLNGTVP